MTRRAGRRGARRLAVMGALLGMLAASAGWADTLPGELPNAGTWSVGLHSGYTVSGDSGSRKIEKVPFHLRLGYTAFTGSPWFFPKGSLTVATEPFAAFVTKKHRGRGRQRRTASFEAGLMLPVLTYHFDIGLYLYPYIEGGLGVIYHDFQGYDLGGGFNFAEMAGGGLSYYWSDRFIIDLGYRFRHASNASLYDENRGLNTHTLVAGFSYLLPAR